MRLDRQRAFAEANTSLRFPCVGQHLPVARQVSVQRRAAQTMQLLALLPILVVGGAGRLLSETIVTTDRQDPARIGPRRQWTTDERGFLGRQSADHSPSSSRLIAPLPKRRLSRISVVDGAAFPLPQQRDDRPLRFRRLGHRLVAFAARG